MTRARPAYDEYKRAGGSGRGLRRGGPNWGAVAHHPAEYAQFGMYGRSLAFSTAALTGMIQACRRRSDAGRAGAPHALSMPDNGATYPANAAVFAGGSALTVTVTVDDEPAAALLVEELSGQVGYLSYARAYRVEPQPEPGQTVRMVSEAGYGGESGLSWSTSRVPRT